MRYRVVVLAFLATLTLQAERARAEFEVIPHMGAMVPTNSMIVTDVSTWFRMETHTVYGIGVGTNITPGVGIEAVLAVGTGSLEGAGTIIAEVASTMFLADLRARLRVAGDSRSHLAIILGAGYTDFDTGLFDAADASGIGVYQGRLTGVAGAGLRTGLADRLGLRLEIVDRVHEQGGKLFGASGFSEKTQNDVVATIGLSYEL